VTFYPNTPKYTQIQLQIILFWDVLWIINDLHCIYTLFFHEFQQNSQVFTDLGRVAYNHEYTQIYIKISTFKSLMIYKLFLYFYRNSDTGLFKTYAVDLKRLLCEQVVCLITEKKGAYWSFPVFIYIFIHIKKEEKE
jgi:hypothetical protein